MKCEYLFPPLLPPLMYELEQPAGEKAVKRAVVGEHSRAHHPAEAAPDRQGVSTQQGQDVHCLTSAFTGALQGRALPPPGCVLGRGARCWALLFICGVTVLVLWPWLCKMRCGFGDAVIQMLSCWEEMS